jgi:hypothetical protein
MDNIKLYCSDGFGGCLTTFGAAKAISKAIFPFSVTCYFSCSDPVFSLLSSFKPKWVNEIHKVEESWYQENSGDFYTFNTTPDLFDQDNKLFDRFGLTWRQIKQKKGLQEKTIARRNVCLAFSTSQHNNHYPYTQELIAYLAKNLQDHYLYFPLVKSWGGKTDLDYQLDFNELSGFKNLIIKEPAEIVSDFHYISDNFKWFIGVDNGIMNFAWHLNAERFLIDLRANPAFNVRWRQNMDDSVNPQYHFESIGRAFVNMIRKPHLSGIKKEFLVARGDGILSELNYK